MSKESEASVYLVVVIVGSWLQVKAWYRTREVAKEFIKQAIKDDPVMQARYLILTVEQPEDE